MDDIAYSIDTSLIKVDDEFSVFSGKHQLVSVLCREAKTTNCTECSKNLSTTVKNKYYFRCILCTLTTAEFIESLGTCVGFKE